MNLKPEKKVEVTYEKFTEELEKTVKPVSEYLAGDRTADDLFQEKKIIGISGNKKACRIEIVADSEEIARFNYSDYEENGTVTATIDIDGEEITKTLNKEDSDEVMEYFVKPALDYKTEGPSDIKGIAAMLALMTAMKAMGEGKKPLEYLLDNIFK